MAPAGFEPAVPASEPPKTHGLDRAVTEIGFLVCYWVKVLVASGTVLPVFSQSLHL